MQEELKGKPTERWGRKATGPRLNRGQDSRVADSAGREVATRFSFWGSASTLVEIASEVVTRLNNYRQYKESQRFPNRADKAL